MELKFWVNLIIEAGEQSQGAKKCLEDNCTLVDTRIWVFEGDIEYLQNHDVQFDVISQSVVPVPENMTKKERIVLYRDILNLKKDPYDQEIEMINNMSQVEMARLWRFAPSGHKYFDKRLPYWKVFKKRFNELGGMTTDVSKAVGWK